MRTRVCLLCMLWVLGPLAASLDAQLANPAPAQPQRNAATGNRGEAAGQSQPPLRPAFPASLGASPIRRIYFYQSQASNLLPRSYWPVDIEDLEAALARNSEVARPGQQRPQLVSAVYVARFDGNALISEADASLLDITYRASEPGILPLGAINLAIQDPGSPATKSQPARLLSQPDGDLQALVSKACRLRFGWTRSGILGPDGRHQFDLSIPACGRTRLLIGIPSGNRLTAQDGVVTTLPSPPPEAAGTTLEKQHVWYAIEAGGLNRIRLAVGPIAVSGSTLKHFAVRQSGLDATARVNGLDWTAKLVVDVPEGESLPDLAVTSGGRITAIRVNGQPVRWQEVAAEEGVRVVFNRKSSNGGDKLATGFEVSGVSPVNLQTVPLSNPLAEALPWIRLDSSVNQSACTENAILLRVQSPLRVAEFGDLGSWQLDDDRSAEGDQRSEFRLIGPADLRPPAVRLVVPSKLESSSAALRLTVADGVIRGRWQGVVTLGASGPRPLQVALQPGWRITAISIRESDRVIEPPGLSSTREPFTIWPEPEEIKAGKLQLQIDGQLEPDVPRQSNELPPSWFVRLLGERTQVTAAVVPPTDFEWEAGTALKGLRISAAEIPTDVVDLLGTINDDTLLFRASGLATPELRWKRPPADFSSNVAVDVRVEQGKIHERVQLTIRVPSAGAPPVRIRLGPPQGRPPMQWEQISAAEKRHKAALIGGDSWRATQIKDPESGGEVWEFIAENVSGDTLVVLGRRQYPIPLMPVSVDGSPATARGGLDDSGGLDDLISEPWELPLPNVFVSSSAPATKHRGVLTLGPRLRLSSMTENVLKVPNARGPAFPLAAVPAENVAANGAVESDWTLRFAPDEDASLRLQYAAESAAPMVVWRKRVEILAGLSGDETMLELETDDLRPLQITFDPLMSITSVEGGSYQNDATQPGRVTLVPKRPGGVLRVRWWRPQPVVSRFRNFSAPQIEIAAVVLQSEWSVWPAADSLALSLGRQAEVPAWMSAEASGVMTPLAPGQVVPLIGSTFAWALAGSIAMLTFSLGWWLLQRWPVCGLLIMVLASMLAIFTPVWSNAILVCLLLPWLAAGLIGSSGIRAGSTIVRSSLFSRSTSRSSSIPAGERPTDAQPANAGAADALPAGNLVGPEATAPEPTAPTQIRRHDVISGPAVGGSSRRLQRCWWLFVLLAGSGPTAYSQDQNSTLNASPQRAVQTPEQASQTPERASQTPEQASQTPERASQTPERASQAGAGQGKSSASPQQPVIEVLIPVTKEGALAGDKVYVPQSLLNTLFRRNEAAQQLAVIEFQSADYQVRISPLGMSGAADSIDIEANWRVEIESADRPVRLPIRPEILSRLEVIVDAMPNEVRPIPDGDGILIRAPRAGTNIFRASLSPAAESTVAGANRVELTIPPVARSTVTITSEVPFEQLSLPNCLGQISRSDSGNRVTAMLGAVPKLEMIWQRRGVNLGGQLEEISRRWWVHVSPAHTAREVELDVGSGIRAGVVVELELDIAELPALTTAAWALAASDSSEPGILRLRMIATVDSPGPIRLLWSNPTSTSAVVSLRLPDVRPTGFQGTIRSLLGVDMPPSWTSSEFDPNTSSVTDQQPRSLDPADFTAAWKGFVGQVRFARQYDGAGPTTLRVERQSRLNRTAKESHRVVVYHDCLTVEYACVLAADGVTNQPLGLLLPPGLTAEQVTINNTPLENLLIDQRVDGETEILLPRLDAGVAVTLSLRGSLQLQPQTVFRPPLIRIAGVDVVGNEYRLLHDEAVVVEQLAKPNASDDSSDDSSGRLSLPPLSNEFDLTAGLAPVGAWRLDARQLAKSPWLSQQFRLRPSVVQLSAESLATLRWEDGLWTMEVVFDVQATNDAINFLTFEIPSRWVDGLNVYPAVKWSAQPATDASTQLIRVLPRRSADQQLALNADQEIEADQEPGQQTGAQPEQRLRIRITSILETTSEGGVAVPDVRLLGDGPRTRYFAAPRRLTSNPIVWQTQNSRAENCPPRFADVAPSEQTHQFYEVIGETFSANLQPAPVGSGAARSPLLEVELFPGELAGKATAETLRPAAADMSVTALLRLHLLPGNRDAVRFRVPPDAKILGAWAGGTAIGVRPVGEPAADKSSQVEVPVGVSRLAQQLVLLVRLPKPSAGQALAIPTAIELPIAATWVSTYDQTASKSTSASNAENTGELASAGNPAMDGPDSPLGIPAAWTAAPARSFQRAADLLDQQPLSDGWQAASREVYRDRIAAAVMAILDDAVDSVAERPSNEKRLWLRPWFARLRQLGWPQDSEATDDLTWQRLDAWAPKLLQRVFGNESITSLELEASLPGTWLLSADHLAPQRVIHIDGSIDTVPVVMLPEVSTQQHPFAGVVWSLGLTLILWGVLAVVYFAWGWTIKLKPAVWLFLLGVLALPFAPLPVSLSAMLVALTGPLVDRRR